MTRKLYYEDCHLYQFQGRVTGCQRTEKGWEVILDASAFYPEGGGQACDIGTLNGIPVMDVQERGEEIIHLCGKSRRLALFVKIGVFTAVSAAV